MSAVDKISGKLQWWKRPAGVSAVCLGLLSVLLLTGIIGLVFYYEDTCHQFSTQSDQQASYNCLIKGDQTTERDQLKTRLRLCKPCPEGWLKFKNSCYFITSIKYNGNDGAKACNAMGGKDVIINSREEQLFIYGLKERVMIGIYKKHGSFYWVDGTPVTSTYWMDGEPNDYDDKEKCVEVIPTALNPLKSWNDVPCGKELVAVCEKKAPTEY
ncbi:hypothetical protein UPYG_G00354000 [Umbra pygmaea]|uniref:C-type lectin domain-containing protein n=1 Tax=Umbra pygmaea TaxID=75934 RepID=A0ABD0VZD1_UMBPY